MTDVIRHAVSSDYLFDGTSLRRNCAVLIDDQRIETVLPRRELPDDIAVENLPEGAWLVPGFIDIQVNGGGDVLFNDTPTAEGIDAIVAAHHQFGTTALLPTLISDTKEKMRAAVQAVQAHVGRNPSVLGVHLEGPFLSHQKPGIHDRRFIREPEPDDLDVLTGLRNGVTVVTLAPECVPKGSITKLTNAGIRVCLGHSMATYIQTQEALAEGLTGFTHLFNAMRPLASREPGPIAAALETQRAWFGIIVDGVHVDPVMLRLALRSGGRAMLVTDAMPPVGGKRTSFMLNGRNITVRNGRCADEEGTLAGAALDMATAIRNCVEMLNIPLTHALRLASAEPACFLGLANTFGHLAAGSRADMVALDPVTVKVLQTWVAGRTCSPKDLSSKF
jgi:N-acetylglucosamine-6-phosphate deacetylase